jgi:hypothetical protein
MGLCGWRPAPGPIRLRRDTEPLYIATAQASPRSSLVSCWFGEIYLILGSFRIFLGIHLSRPGVDEISSLLCRIVQICADLCRFFNSWVRFAFCFRPHQCRPDLTPRSSLLCRIVQFSNSAAGSFRIFMLGNGRPGRVFAIFIPCGAEFRSDAAGDKALLYEIFCCQLRMTGGHPRR